MNKIFKLDRNLYQKYRKKYDDSVQQFKDEIPELMRIYKIEDEETFINTKLSQAWSAADDHAKAGILFTIVNPADTGDDNDRIESPHRTRGQFAGCLTQIRNINRSAFNDKHIQSIILTEAIANDRRLPPTPDLLRLEHTDLFSHWQTLLDLHYDHKLNEDECVMLALAGTNYNDAMTKVIKDYYDRQVKLVIANFHKIEDVWGSPRTYADEGGMLFDYVRNPNHEATKHTLVEGCLTQIHKAKNWNWDYTYIHTNLKHNALNKYNHTSRLLTRAIIKDKRLPNGWLDITIESLPVLAQWQTGIKLYYLGAFTIPETIQYAMKEIINEQPIPEQV